MITTVLTTSPSTPAPNMRMRRPVPISECSVQISPDVPFVLVRVNIARLPRLLWFVVRETGRFERVGSAARFARGLIAARRQVALRRAHRRQELVDLDLQPVAFTCQRLRRAEH